MTLPVVQAILVFIIILLYFLTILPLRRSYLALAPLTSGAEVVCADLRCEEHFSVCTNYKCSLALRDFAFSMKMC